MEIITRKCTTYGHAMERTTTNYCIESVIALIGGLGYKKLIVNDIGAKAE